jgi:phosphate transport system substrate-binding protein
MVPIRRALSCLAVLGLAVLLVCFAGCSRPSETSTAQTPGAKGGPSPAAKTGGAPSTIVIKGSDTEVALAGRWAEEFMKTHPDITVSVTGGGSGTGIAALENGTCDIADASRDITPDEAKQIAAQGHPPVEVNVAWDGIAVIVNPQNPVKQLTLPQLSDIFTGKITNWKQVGGNDRPIVLLIRETSSGTYQFFKERVLQLDGKRKDADYSVKALNQASNQQIHDEISSNPDGIGYVGLAFVDPKVHALAVANDDKGPFLQPNLDDVVSRRYPIARPLHNYLARPAEGAVKEYIDFVLGPQGQDIVKEMGFVPVPKKAAPAQPEAPAKAEPKG